jgi:hypothetical protein
MFLDLILRAQHFVQKSGGKSGTPEKIFCIHNWHFVSTAKYY